MTKPKFRSRKIDQRRAMPIYRPYDVPDMDEGNNNVQRSVAAIETGVEKDEESVCGHMTINPKKCLYYCFAGAPLASGDFREAGRSNQ